MENILLYAGIAVMGVSLLGGLIFLVVYIISGVKLSAAFDKEYGENRNGKNKSA